MRSNSKKSRKKKKKKERWNWDDQSKAVMTPMTERITFKKFLEDWDRGYNYEGPQRDDWQEDIDDRGASVGVCPKCGGEAHYTSSGKSYREAKSFWECQECGHQGEKRGY